MATAVVLTLYAVALAWPVPHLLAASHWPHRCPRAAIVLWQAVGLAGGVSALLAAAAFTVSPLSPRIPTAIADHAANVAAGVPLEGLGWVNLASLAAASALAARLFGVLGASTASTLRERHRHRHLVDLAGRHHWQPDTASASASALPSRSPSAREERVTEHAQSPPPPPPPPPSESTGHSRKAGTRLRVLEHPVAVAYCVPGVRHPRVVVSRGLLTTLTPAELDAVLAHEEAHVSSRHDLVIQPFVAWERTFPFLQPAREATCAVSLLVEMLADDTAARQAGGPTLARALARLGVARAPVPAGALGIIDVTTATAPVVPLPAPIPAPAIAAASPTGATTLPAVGATGSPVVSRIARLLDPPAVPWWLQAGVYLGAAAVLAVPTSVFLLLG